MEYVDWIMSFGVFIIIFIAVIVALPNFLPDVNLQENTFAAKNVYNNLTEEIDTYVIITDKDNKQIQPYLISLNNSLGRANGIGLADNNLAFGLAYNKNKFYNFNEYNNNVNKTLLINEDFEDYNYTDSFLLENGVAFIEAGTLNINDLTILATKESFSNFTSSLEFKGDDLNVYFNYIDPNNYYIFNITNEDVSLYLKINENINLIETKDYTKTKNWNNFTFGIDINNIYCGPTNNQIIIDNNYSIQPGKIKIIGIDNNSFIDNFKIYQNSDLNIQENNSIITNNLKASINNNQINFNKENLFDFNINYSSNLDFNKNKQIINIKDQENIIRSTIFPNIKEFWVYVYPGEDLNLIPNGNLKLKSYDYYIEDNGSSRDIWSKIDLKQNETKTLYLYKKNGNSPNGDKVFDFFDDFEEGQLDKNKWIPFGEDFGTLSFDSEEGVNFRKLKISNLTGTEKDFIGIYSNKDYMTFGKILTTRSKMISGRHSTLIGYASEPYRPYPHGDSITDGFSWYGDADNHSSALSFAFSTNNTTNEKITHDPTTYNLYDAKLIAENKLEIYKNKNLVFTQNDASYLPNYELPVYFSADGHIKANVVVIDYIFIRTYIPNEPTVNVTSLQNNVYKIEITNNQEEDLYNYQVKIPNNLINVSSKQESIYLLDNLTSNKNYLEFKNSENSYLTINAFDFFNNENTCDFTLHDDENITINNCNKNTILKIRFSDQEININYPIINIFKTKEKIITKERLDSLNLFSTSIPYYIKNTGSELSLWSKINLSSAQSTKVYVSKENGYLPSDENLFNFLEEPLEDIKSNVKQINDNLYEIEVINNTFNNVVGYQINIPNNILNLISTDESLKLYTIDNYYLSITNKTKTLNIEKGTNKSKVSKILERYTTYLNEKGEEEIIKIIIKPN